MSESNTAGEMLARLARSPAKGFGRLALVVENSSLSMTAARLRELVPTFCVSSLAEVMNALSAHGRDEDSKGTISEITTTQALVGLDITGISEEEVEQFAHNLPASQKTGTVYVMTPTQFDFFNASLFDFVVR
jgi:hypothetical protein